MKTFYVMANGFQHLEHCMAVYEWLGGTFYVIRHKPEVNAWLTKHNISNHVADIDALHKHKDSKDIALVIPALSHGFSVLKDMPNLFYTAHGTGEKDFYSKDEATPHGHKIPLQFARYIRGTYEYSLTHHRTYFNVNPARKTVVYIPTQGTFSSFSDKTIRICEQLKTKYNVLIKPHALCWELTPNLITRASQSFRLNPELHNVMPFIDLADVVIGDISASTSASVYFDKPIILIKDLKYSSSDKRLMGDHVCSIVSMSTPDNILAEVDSCLADPMCKSEARKEYFKYWYGTVDGTEGKQFADKIMDTMSKL
jgi:hypothetical protein